MSSAPMSAATHSMIDRYKAQAAALQLFTTTRLTGHQYMRNFAIGVGIQFALIPLVVVFALVLGVGAHLSGREVESVGTLLQTIELICMVGFTLLTAWIQICASIQRFHDMGKPGVYALWMFVPLINIYFIYRLITSPSVPEANVYGPIPGEVANKHSIEVWFLIAWLVLIGLSFL